MTGKQINEILELFSVTPNAWVEIKNINRVNLQNDSNVAFCSYNRYFFDMTNDLLKIKKYNRVGDKLIAKTNYLSDEYINFEEITSFTFGKVFS